MSIRNWVVGKLRDDYEIEPEGEHGLRIKRETRPLSLVYCADTDGVGRFTFDDLEAACRELPAFQVVVLVRRDADNEAYERAEELGVCLAGLGDLKSALRHDLNIGQHLSSEQAYLLSRLQINRHVVSVRRCGRCAYEVLRKVPMPSLTIVATEDYELTSDCVYELLDQYGGIDVHAIVSTSPACFGFAGEVLAAGKRTGTRIFNLNQLLDALGRTWN
jgi:hypothetical protein